MDTYQLGLDEPYDLEREDDADWEWIVHDYMEGDYEGSGEAVGLNKKDGLLYVADLSHCSCNGPFDGGLDWSGVKCTIEDFCRNKDHVLDYDAGYRVKDKVKELVGWVD